MYKSEYVFATCQYYLMEASKQEVNKQWHKQKTIDWETRENIASKCVSQNAFRVRWEKNHNYLSLTWIDLIFG